MEEIRRQLADADTEIRRSAVESLRGVKTREGLSLLLEAMKDGSWRVRKSAVDILFEDYPIEQYMQGLVSLLYIEDNAGARNSAIEAMIRLGRRATPYLIEAYRTPNKDVRKFIIDVLGDQMDSRCLPLMLEAIKDEDENVRATAVEHLGKVGEVSVVDALIEILNSGDLWTAYPAADALGRIGNRKAVSHLLAALSQKPLREPVLKALGMLADPSTLDPVIRLLETGGRSIQEQALRTIERMYHNGISASTISEQLRNILGERAIELLVNHAWSSKKDVRISSILILGLMRDEVAYGPLLDISHEEEFSDDVKKALVFIGSDKPESLLKLFDTENTHQLRFICDVAGTIVSPAYFDVFVRLLGHEDGHVRSIAALSISRLNDRTAVDHLMTLLNDPYEDVQEAAVDALAFLGEYLDVNELLKLLTDDNPQLRKNAALVLGKIEVDRAVPDLGFALKDADHRVRKASVEALSLIGSRDAVRYLTHALTDEYADIRISATLSLGAIGGSGTFEALTILVSDPDNSVRVAAARALGTLGDSRGVPVLIGLLGDPSGFVVTTSIESLQTLDGQDARDAILSMLGSADQEIRRTAISALVAFGGVEHALLPFLNDPDWATRIAAVRTLGRSSITAVRTELEKLLDTEEDPTVVKIIEETLHV